MHPEKFYDIDSPDFFVDPFLNMIRDPRQIIYDDKYGTEHIEKGNKPKGKHVVMCVFEPDQKVHEADFLDQFAPVINKKRLLDFHGHQYTTEEFSGESLYLDRLVAYKIGSNLKHENHLIDSYVSIDINGILTHCCGFDHVTFAPPHSHLHMAKSALLFFEFLDMITELLHSSANGTVHFGIKNTHNLILNNHIEEPDYLRKSPYRNLSMNFLEKMPFSTKKHEEMTYKLAKHVANAFGYFHPGCYAPDSKTRFRHDLLDPAYMADKQP